MPLFHRAVMLWCASQMAIAGVNPATYDSLHLNWRDTQVAPAHDFYHYANGRWQMNHPIPADYSNWTSFSILSLKMQIEIKHMLEKAARPPHALPGSLTQKIGDFYYSAMNEKAINKAGFTPLKPELARIDAIQDLASLKTEIAHLHSLGVDVLFSLGSMQDFKHSERVIGCAVQGGLSLPDRDFYLSNEPRLKAIREAFEQYTARILQLIGETPEQAAKSAQTILRIETELARASMPQVKMRDPYAVYHLMDVAQLQSLTPHFSWTDYLNALGVGHIKQLNVATPDFLKELDKQLSQIALSDWLIYLRWHLISHYSAYLSEPFVKENFKMQRLLTGIETLPPRWKRVVATESGILGFAIGERYVEQHDLTKVAARVATMMNGIHKVLKDDLETRSWMTASTRKAALAKLALMEERIGGPKVWWDYSSYQVDRGSYVLNVLRGNQFLVQRDLNKIGQPVDRSEWLMTPQAINAYYDPSMNNINIPYGILQPPFFDLSAPDAVNYGAIGSVIGHEITHGFDDQGAKFDGHGNLHDWWTPSDFKQFKAATDCLAKQFSQYTIADGAKVNGRLVVGEATADLGGLTLAYRAFKQSDAYKKAKTIKSLTPDQQFFLGFAHVWAGNIRPEQARVNVMVDPHPPALYRVNGTMANMPEFSQAFGLESLAKEVKRCVIW
jgi:putative endopeptidase